MLANTVMRNVSLWHGVNHNKWNDMQKSTLIPNMLFNEMLTRQGQEPTSFGRLMKTIVEHATQSCIPATCPQQPRYANIW
jgi:hypothetical protein